MNFLDENDPKKLRLHAFTMHFVQREKMAKSNEDERHVRSDFF